MGNTGDKGQVDATRSPIPSDRFHSIEEVTTALEEAGLEASDLVIGIDFTDSNATQGTKTFEGRSLHAIEEGVRNPYQHVIEILARTLAKFDEDDLIPVYGFGDAVSTDKTVFQLEGSKKDGLCYQFEEVLKVYGEVAPTVELQGPTNFAPIIEKAVEHVCETQRAQYHILVIMADGQVDDVESTVSAIVAASDWPLSIIAVGVGDGPFDQLIHFDDQVQDRKFDNFNFVNYAEVVAEAEEKGVEPDVLFALRATMEIPDQYRAICQLHLVGKSTQETQEEEE